MTHTEGGADSAPSFSKDDIAKMTGFQALVALRELEPFTEARKQVRVPSDLVDVADDAMYNSVRLIMMENDLLERMGVPHHTG